MNSFLKRACTGAAVILAFASTAQAQWSIGAPGSREAPRGEDRYAYLVMSDPLPGREFDFNDAYQNTHMGDLVQLPGWTGAQRFRLVQVMPRTTKPLYRRGYLIIWDQEGDDLGRIQSESRAAIAGGKSRLIAGFDYSADGPVSTTYRVTGPRVTRPDGRKSFMPAADDNKTPRPNRYVQLDFVEPGPGISNADFEAAVSREINQVLTLPGWMAAQRFRLAPTPATSAPPRLAFTRYLIIWETEGATAQALQDARAAAVKSGQVAPLAADPNTAQSSWWMTISPFITKEDFER